MIDELDPAEFWQIHRATLVRVDAVEQVSRNFRGNQLVREAYLGHADDAEEVRS